MASESESVHPSGLERSGKELKSSVKRLMHSALLLSGTNEVSVLVDDLDVLLACMCQHDKY